MPIPAAVGAAIIGGGALLGSGLTGTIGQAIQSRRDRRHFEEDRAHSEMREDTTMARRFNEAKELGIHPHSIMGGQNSGSHIQGNGGAHELMHLANTLGSVAQMSMALLLTQQTRRVHRTSG